MLFFYILSVKLSKSDFGLISWSTATAMTMTAALSFGLELVVTRRVATSRSSWAASAFLLHTVLTTLMLGSILIVLRLVVRPDDESNLFWLPLFFAVQCVAYIATPFKCALNARERFGPFAVISFVSNSIKVALAVYWTVFAPWSIWIALYILGICSVFEFVALLAYTLKCNPISTRFRMLAYRKLLKEAAPQFLTVLFDSSLARFSWILLGVLITSAAVVADYSFVFRAYEMGKMPVLAIGMILLPRLSRIAARGDGGIAGLSDTLILVLKAEMLGAFALVLVGNLVWSPWVDALTDGRYGTPNQWIFMILSVCIPSQFAINLMWASLFAEKQFTQLSRITILTGITNLGAAFLLIPVLQGTGAALAFLLATGVQTALYAREMKCAGFPLSLRPMFDCLLLAAVIMAAVRLMPVPVLVQVACAIIAYLIGAWSIGLLGKQNLLDLRSFLQR